MSVWCEHCRDHFPESHYELGPEGYEVHKTGEQYGPTGAGRQAQALLAQALANNPIDRKLVTEAYRLLAGLPAPEEDE